MIDFQPIRDKVYLRVSPRPEKTKSGLFIPLAAHGRLNRGVVIAVGPESELQAGDDVVFDPYKLDIVFERGEYLKGTPATPTGTEGDTAILSESAVIAVVTYW